jgi:predicted negative regulator of RcsB-dependent stress response
MSSIPAANAAVRLAPSDAEAHRARAAVLSRLRLFSVAKDELELATALRPHDDYLWLELGNVRDELGDTQGALAALNQAVRFAPYYAHTHWQRGNLLLRTGNYAEGFADLRQAANSNRDLMPSLIDLAWGLSRGEAALTERLIQVNDDKTRLTLARFLARKGRAQEAISQFRRASGSISEDSKRDMIQQLIGANAFKEAFEIWSGSDVPETPSVYDGGFEGPLRLDEVGFGWRVPREAQAISLSLDVTHPHSGAKSLRIQFNGNSNPAAQIVSQLMVVKAMRHYRINFAASTKDIVTGSLPMIMINDAVTGQVLSKSATLPQATNPWQVLTCEFTTLPTTEAVILSLQRSGCGSPPCPIFGFLWLDDFSIEELTK